MRILSTTLSVLVLGTTIATAQTGLDPVVDTLRSQGYRSIEVEREGSRIKVEGRRGGQERELVYDARTGRLISDERRARSGDTGLGALFGGNPSWARGGDDDDDDDGRRGGYRVDDDDDDDDDRAGGGWSAGGGDRDDDDDDRGGGGGGGNDSDDDDDDDD